MANLNDRRRTVTYRMVQDIADQAVSDLLQKMHEKGPGAFVHRHEVMGCLYEEWNELIEAAHDRSQERMIAELYDIAMAAIFSIASVALMPPGQR